MWTRARDSKAASSIEEEILELLTNLPLSELMDRYAVVDQLEKNEIGFSALICRLLTIRISSDFKFFFLLPFVMKGFLPREYSREKSGGKYEREDLCVSFSLSLSIYIGADSRMF